MTTVVFCTGMGVDSVAAVSRLILDDSVRDFDLPDLVVLIAQVGDEYLSTKELMEQHFLPLTRRYGIRVIQIARAGQSSRHGYVVLSDSRDTRHMVMRGPWALSDELLSNGVLPQVAARRCSGRAKGEILDAWIADNVTPPFVHMIGFAHDEQRRIQRDITHHSRPGRIARFPLDEWRWTRTEAADWIRQAFGVEWSRSCCEYCPFQFNRAGEMALADRWRREPTAAARALVLEATALPLNPRAGKLFASRSAREFATSHHLHEALHLADDHLRRSVWAAYRVRRIFHPASGNPAVKGPAWRAVQRLETGSHPHIHEVIRLLAHRAAIPVDHDDHDIARAWLRRVVPPYPALEEFYVPAPATVLDKARRGFDSAWDRLIETPAVRIGP